MTQCTSQIDLFAIGRRRVTLTSEGRHLTSNAGVLVLGRVERQLKLSSHLAEVLIDERAPHLVRHTTENLIRQRVLQIACGYEDANDATALRHEPAFQAAMHRVPGAVGSELASQPTLSRLEQREGEEIERLSEVLLSIWVERVRSKKSVILDFDTTDDETHGAQQLSFFQGHYGHTMYHPLLVFDDEGWPVAVMLRPGNAHASAGAVEVLREIKARLPKGMKVLLRADAGFAVPGMYVACEELGIEYVIAQTVHEKYKKLTAGMAERVEQTYRQTGQGAREYDEFEYRARTWKRHRRVIAKAEKTKENSCVRYLVTNISTGSPEQIYVLYTGRGQSENYIKDLKNAVFGDRLSCSAFTSNCFRLMLHTAAYMLMHELRRRLAGTALQRAQMDTLRLKLLKVGASIVISARRIWVYLSEHDPARVLLEAAAQRLVAAPT